MALGTFFGLALGVQLKESPVFEVPHNGSAGDISLQTILIANLIVIAGLAVGGILSLGLASIFISFTTGMQLGIAIFVIAQLSDWRLTLLLLPHGLIEFAGMIIAGAIGIKPLFVIYGYLRGERKSLEEYLSRERIMPTLKLMFLSLLCIVAAAFIETYVTGGLVLRSLT